MATIGLAEVTFDVMGMTHLEGAWDVAFDHLVQDLEFAAQSAAEAAIEEMQRNHPYTDRTYLLSGGMHVTNGRRSRLRCIKFVDFMAPYAKWVNDGTVKSKPYPFIPQGVAAAQAKLEKCMDDAMNSFCQTLKER